MKIHFVGIGGIGVSSLARFYIYHGHQVSGSDINESEITHNLESAGAVIYLGHHPEKINPQINKIIYTAAVTANNPELIHARALNIPTLSYAESLGELTKKYFTICVSGSHGKSTTTALLALMLIKAGLDPIVIIGTRLKEFDGANFRVGKGNYLIIEADEWNNSFHHYHPRIVVLTNIDKEHLDTHGDLAGVIKNFNIYLRRVPEQGSIIINSQDDNSLKAIKECNGKVVFYNYSKLLWPLQIPGCHNQLNCAAAYEAAKLLGISHSVAEGAVKNFTGSWRRMEELKPINNVIPDLIRNPNFKFKTIFYSDYAHHPTEIKATAQALREKHPDKKIICVFQPHQVERVTQLFDDFLTAFDDFDQVGILPIYEVIGRERGDGLVPEYVEGLPLLKTSQDLVDTLSFRTRSNPESKVFYFPNLEKSFELIQPNSIVVFMGAGDIDKEVRKHFKSKLLDS